MATIRQDQTWSGDGAGCAIDGVGLSNGITLLDLDRTVTVHGTYSLFLLFGAWRRAPWRLLLVPGAIGAMLGYRLRMIDRRRLKEIMHRLLLGRWLDPIATQRLAEAYAEFTLARNLHADAVSLIAQEQAEGRLVILTTAAHRFYAAAIARRLGITEVVATESESREGRLSHRIAGRNCYGAAKAARVAARLVQMGLNRDALHLRCYSDDHSDLPIFEASDEPIAVNPSTRLERHASRKGWRMLRFDAARAPARAAAAPPSLALRPSL